MSGIIEAIFTSAERHGEIVACEAVQLKSGRGIVGDRFFGRSRTTPGRNLTLIEAEAITAAGIELGLVIAPQAPRRNLVTRGLRLNALVGKTFRVGNILCRGIELCDPCIVLGRHLASEQHSAAAIIAAFEKRGGLRAAVLGDGILRRGDPVTADTSAGEA
jgi:MOSC domain-containing protein YiiM